MIIFGLPVFGLDYYQCLSSENEREKGNLLSGIIAIASDVDGTLLSSDQTLHPRTRDAVIRAVEVTTLPSHRLRHFFLATGKSRIGALRSLGPRMKDILSKVPGVFLQGLYCVNAQGEVIYERKLPNEVIALVNCQSKVAQHKLDFFKVYFLKAKWYASKTQEFDVFNCLSSP